IEATDDVHERALARARGAHDGHELPRGDRKRHTVERAHLDLAHLVDPDEVFDADDVGRGRRRGRDCLRQKPRRPPAGPPGPPMGEPPEAAFAVARPMMTVSPGLSSPETTCVKRPSVIPVRTSTGLGSAFGSGDGSQTVWGLMRPGRPAPPPPPGPRPP